MMCIMYISVHVMYVVGVWVCVCVLLWCMIVWWFEMSSATKQERDITNSKRGMHIGRFRMAVSIMTIIIYDWNSYLYCTTISCCIVFARCCISRCEQIVNINNREYEASSTNEP